MYTRLFPMIAGAMAIGISFGGISCRNDSDSDGLSDGGDADNDGTNGNNTGRKGTGWLNEESCRFVDVVIAVDGSGSMKEELQAMRTTVFPAFANRLGDIADGLDDFRIATLDGCPTPSNFHTRGSGGECEFQGGNVWINSDSSAMNEEFACVGDIYLADSRCSGDNDDEQPTSAVIAALEGNENSGFLRSEALLVVIAITDEDEQSTTMNGADELYQRLVALKGDAEKIVFLGIGGSQQCTGTYGDAEEARMLRQLTGMFEADNRGVWWDLCQGQLEDGLEQAFGIIEQACEEFPPPIV